MRESLGVFLWTVVYMTLVGIVLVVPLSLHLVMSFLNTKGGGP